MCLVKYLVVALIFLSATFIAAAAQIKIQPDDLVVCPYHEIVGSPDRLGLNDCKTVSIRDIDPQKREIWVFGNLTVQTESLSNAAPLGLFISAKASTKVYLNGTYLGSNGTPGPHKTAETPGTMDAVIYVPAERLKLGRNEFALHMSSHNGWLSLRSPVHYLALAEHVNPTHNTLSHYWPSLLPFGALLIGAFYMGMLAFVKRDHWSVALLPLMSLVGAAQLYAEVYRGLS